MQSQVCRKSSDAFDFRARIGFGIQSMAVALVFLAIPKVYPTRQLPYDGEVNAATDRGFERGYIDKRVGGEVARSKIAECTHLLAEAKEPLFGTHEAGAPFLSELSIDRNRLYWKPKTYGASNCAQDYGVGILGSVQGLVSQRGAGRID